MKVGDIVKLQHGNAKVVFVDKKEVLLDCDNTDDGEFYMSAKAGYVPKRHGRRLKWLKKVDCQRLKGQELTKAQVDQPKFFENYVI